MQPGLYIALENIASVSRNAWEKSIFPRTIMLSFALTVIFYSLVPSRIKIGPHRTQESRSDLVYIPEVSLDRIFSKIVFEEQSTFYSERYNLDIQKYT